MLRVSRFSRREYISSISVFNKVVRFRSVSLWIREFFYIIEDFSSSFFEDSKYRSHFYFIRFGVDLFLLVHLEYVESVKEESVGFSLMQRLRLKYISFDLNKFN